MHHFTKTLLAMLFYLLCSPGITQAELPNAANRPFWTQKTCYRDGDMVYGVGLSMGETTLEKARKQSFETALWEIANYAQLTDTTLLMVETQMTYEEQNADDTFSVWRLVKIPFKMLKSSKNTTQEKDFSYGPFVDSIQKPEKMPATELRENISDDLRAILTSEETDTTAPGAFGDREMPTGHIEGFRKTYSPDEIITLELHAKDNEKLKRVLFSVTNSHIRKTWTPKGKTFLKKISFSTTGLAPGEHPYAMKILDTAGNVSVRKGKFTIMALQSELRELLLND